MEDISIAFEEETGIKIELISGASGQLVNQISNGAPFDVFLSADLSYAAQLSEKNLSDGDLLVFAEGKLVIWTTGPYRVNPNTLLNPEHTKIAIPNPAIAPYGKAAMDYLSTQKYLEKIESKLVYGESVGQTSLFISSGSAEIGITSKSSVLNPKVRNIGDWFEIPAYSYGSLLQCCTILKSSEKKENAKKFQEFLTSETAKQILIEHGYDMPGPREF
jgi:molybdate transport system substrate-binding protein